MLRTRIFLGVIISLFLLYSPIGAMELKITGDHAKNVSLQFNSSGADLSTPESTVKTLGTLHALSESSKRNLDGKFMEILLLSAKETLKPFFSEESFKNFFQKTEESLKNRLKKQTSATKYATRVSIDEKNTLADGTVEIFYSIHTTRSYNCYTCKGKGECPRCKGEKGKKCYVCQGTSKCRYCKGTGRRENTNKISQKAHLVQKGEKWLIRACFTPCWSCRSTGKCRSCTTKKNPAGGYKVPGRGSQPDLSKGGKCWSCKGTGLCKYCQGTKYTWGKRIITFLPAPRVYRGDIPSFENFKADLSTPEKFFQSFLQAVKLCNGLEPIMESKLGKDVAKIENFFAEKTDALQGSERSWKGPEIDLVKREKTAEGFDFFCLKKSRYRGGNGLKFTLAVVKGKEGTLQIAGMLAQCNRCRGTGKYLRNYYNYICPDHPKAGSIATKRGYQCSTCKKNLRATLKRKEIPCPQCEGKGRQPLNFQHLMR